MNTIALILWLSTITIVTAVCGYFFYKVLVTPHGRSEDDEQPIPPTKSFDVT